MRSKINRFQQFFSSNMTITCSKEVIFNKWNAQRVEIIERNKNGTLLPFALLWIVRVPKKNLDRKNLLLVLETYWLLLEKKQASQQTFVLMKTSWRRLEDVFCLRLRKTSLRRLQDVLVKTSMFALALHLQKTSSRLLQDVFKTFWRRLQDVFKISSRRFAKISSRDFQGIPSS